MKDIVLLDLFSGVGGFHAGLELAGFTIRKSFFSEIEKHPIAIYKHKFPNATYVGSVTTFREWERLPGWERPNIVTFGSPCQDFSLAGKRRGMAGERSSLVEYAIDIISEWRPDFFIWENVKGVFSSNDGADFWAVIQAFANIGGYRLEWQLLNTAWILPQSRERVYLVGSLADRCGGGVFPVREDDFNAIETQGQAHRSGERLRSEDCATSLRAGATDHGAMTLIQPVLTPDRLVKRQNGRRFKQDGEEAFTLNTQDVHGVAITFERTEEGKKLRRLYEQGNIDHGFNEHRQVTERKDGLNNALDSSDKSKMVAIKSNTAQGYDVAAPGDVINFSQPNSKTGRGRVGKGTAQTLETQPTQGVGEPSTRIRRLTEIECERLQGFEDDWTAIGINDKGEQYKVPKTARYKAMGNAVTVDIVALVGRAIRRACNLDSF